jgi:hypothetical protein
MQTNLYTTMDLRWAQTQGRIPEAIFQQYMLAGMLSVQLRQTPMAMLGREHGVKREYPIIAFEVLADVRKEGHRRDEYTHHMVVPVIDQPQLKASKITAMQRDANVFSLVLNRGYVEPPVEPAPEDETEGTPGSNLWREQRLGSGKPHVELEWSPQAWQEVAYHQVSLLRMWAETFNQPSQIFKRFGQGEVVVWRQELQPERWPQVPLFKVVTQVEPFINDARNSYGSIGIVDTILMPATFNTGMGSSPFYARSEDIYTLAQYEQLLLSKPQFPGYSMARGGGDFEPSPFMVEEVMNKIPEEIRKGNF